MSSEAPAKPRPPKLGPRKPSCQQPGSPAPKPVERTSSAADTTPKKKPPKLGPRKSSVQESSASINGAAAPSATTAGANESNAATGAKAPPQGAAGTDGSASKTSTQAASTSSKTPVVSKTQTDGEKEKEKRKPAKLPPKSSIKEEAEPTKSAAPKIPKLGPKKNSQYGQQQNGSTAGQNTAKGESKANAKKSKEEESLTTILGQRQRTQLIILLASATATMRDNLMAIFEASMGASSQSLRGSTNLTEDEKIMNANVDPGTADVAAHDKERKALAQREKEVSAKEMQALKTTAEDWFDSWREKAIGRVGEVLNSAKEAKGELGGQDAQEAKPTSKAPDRKINAGEENAETEKGANEDVEMVLKELYPPVKTPLVKLEHEKRVMILHSVLLLLLSTEHYASASRVLLLFLMSSLDLSLDTLKKDEDKTAHGLLESARELSGTFETQKKAELNARARKWKVGLASVAGAAIVGVTGGMAAPMVAAGVSSVMGGLGLGATAAAGYLGSVAGSTMVVGSLFGAYGGRMTGQMMDNYAKEVSDFAFIPVHSQKKHLMDSKGKGEKAEAEAGQKDPGSRRLRVTIGITGWLTEKEEVVKPWSVLSDGSEAFALRWELETLLNLGNSMTELMSSAAWGYAQRQVVSQTIFADLTAAMWPLALVKAARVVDNPFSLAMSRAEKAGEVLADALINHAQGERPVNLVGYSLGARVIYSCLLSLANRRAFGLIENVAMFGAPVPNRSAEWRRMRSVVAGRLVNVFSENDYVLSFLYRTSSAQYGVAGLQHVDGVAGVENVDVSETVSGHLRYRFMVGHILKKIGFEDLDRKEVEKEEEALRQMDEAEAKKMEELKKKLPARLTKGKEGEEEEAEMSEADAEKQADEMEKNVEERTQTTMMQRGAELLHLSGRNKNGSSAQDSSKNEGASSYLSYMPSWRANQKGSGEAAEAQAAESAEMPSQSDDAAAKSSRKSYLSMASDKIYGSKTEAAQSTKDHNKPDEEKEKEKDDSGQTDGDLEAQAEQPTKETGKPDEEKAESSVEQTDENTEQQMDQPTKEQGEPEEDDEIEEDHQPEKDEKVEEDHEPEKDEKIEDLDPEESDPRQTGGSSAKQANNPTKEQGEPEEEQSGSGQTQGTTNGNEKQNASKSYVRRAANAMPSFPRKAPAT